MKINIKNVELFCLGSIFFQKDDQKEKKQKEENEINIFMII